jgi:hypothetical protein
MKATNIKWDTDGYVIEWLPTIVEIPQDIVDEMEDENDTDAITDYLSDEYGFCVEGYDLDTDKK